MRDKLWVLARVGSCIAMVIATIVATAFLAPEDRVLAAPADPPVAASKDFNSQVTPLLRQYCYECHGDGASAGDLELDGYETREQMVEATSTWQKVIAYARNHVMPPPEADAHPSQDERDQIVAAIQQQLYQFDPANPDPGRVTIRRLNRAEYRNTVRDLLGVTFDPTIDFPQDDTGYGFDNIGDVLTLPPMLMEKYLLSAEKLLDEAIPPQQAKHEVRRVAATAAKASFEPAADRVSDGWVELTSAQEDSLSVPNLSPAPAEYRVRVLAYASYFAPPPAGETDNPPLKLSLMVDDAVAGEIDVAADESKPRWYEMKVGTPGDRHALRVSMRRQRGLEADRHITAGRIGLEQRGTVHVKEILVEGPVAGGVRRFRGEGLRTAGDTAQRQGRMAVLHRTEDTAFADVKIPADGKYLLRLQAYADQAGNEPPIVELRLDDKPVGTFAITAPAAYQPAPGAAEVSPEASRAVPRVYQIQTTLLAGQRRLSARFTNNLLDKDNPDPNRRDRNVYVQHIDVVEIGGDPVTAPLTQPMRKLFADRDPDEDGARAILTDFTLRAWRRPAHAEEVDRLMELYRFARSNGEDFHGGVKHAMKGVLVSSSFLFRGEPERDEANGLHQIGEYELASRLSYFLWSSMPDDELLQLAGAGRLRDNLEPQVKRMLASPKADALVDNFAGQWLQFRNLDAAHPDAELFESYTDRLRDAMKRETGMLFESIMRENRSLLEILTADYTFVNERLAKHYGIDGVNGEQFRRVSLEGTPRRGVLTHGSVLTLTSNPTRTSPVKRGNWVLENLLGAAPPPPPPDLPPLVGDGEKLTGTVRQQLEKHRADPTCASCHAPMDPIGFGLENFNPIGAWREKDGSHPVDATSAFQGGPMFTGARELVEILATSRRNDFLRATTEKTLTFALGRGVEPYDQPAVETIVTALQGDDAKFSTLILGVVNSVPFQMRRGSESESTVQTTADQENADQHRDDSAVAEVGHER
jgi:mono/diheme cytochrome c family protein